MKPTRSKSRKTLTIGAEQSNAAHQEDTSEGQESPRIQPANEEAIPRMAEFVTENPNIFEKFGRYLKRQGKQKAESSKRKSNRSPKGSSEESDGRRLSRSASNRAFSKATSKVASLTKAFSRGLLGQRLEEEPRLLGRSGVDYMRTPPFTDDINEERLPPNFNLLSIQSYDGRGDPEDHIHAFISVFRLYCIPDLVICRAFPVFLQGTARKWFWGLEPRNISTLGELVERFLHRFMSSRPTTRTSAYLLNMQQNPGKSLRSYVQRFHEKSVQIPDPNEQVTIAAFTHGLVVGVFNTGIHKKYPHTLHELWLKVEKGIHAEDLNRMKKEVQAARPRADPRSGKELGRSEVGTGSDFQNSSRDRHSVFDRISKGKSSILDSELTPLNTTRSRVLSVMEQNNLGKAPLKMYSSRDKRNSNLYCLYHRDIGHETEDCNDLKREIENLIRQGRLKQFIRRSGGHQRDENRRIRIWAKHCWNHQHYCRRFDGRDSQNSRKRTYRQANPDQAESSSRLSEVISYGPTDPVPTASSSHEAVVIEVLTNNYIVKKVYIDPKNSVDVMYLRTFESLKLTREHMTPVRTPLVGFGRHVVHPERMVTLTVTVGHQPRCRTIPVSFVIVKADSPYNLLLGQPTFNALRAVYSTYHLNFKFPTPAGIAEVSSDVCAARECYLATLQAASTSASDVRLEKRSNILSIDGLDPQQAEKAPRLESGDEVKEISLDLTKPERTIRVGIRLADPIKRDMVDLLREYRDVFAWAAEEVKGVPHHLMVHKLNVDSQARPVKQKRRYLGPERSRAVGVSPDRNESRGLGEDGILYIPRHILLHHHAFRTKNAGATNQRLVNQAFKSQIERNVETYMDDILLKSRTTSTFLSDLREVFEVLRETRMMLNPKKCIFGVISEKFLGYLVSMRGIEANSDKVRAIQEMSPPRCIRDVQRLTGRLAALNRFLSQLASKALPFFKILKKADSFSWTEECQQAFEQLKEYLHHLLTLTSPRLGNKLYLYLSVAVEAMSAVLVREEGVQVPIYYVSRVLRDPETRYTQAEKLVLALIHAARRLKPYFLDHHVCLRTDQPLRQVLSRPEASGRLTKWAIELGEYDLSYEPRTAIKAQTLADFLAKLTFDGVNESILDTASVTTAPRRWIFNVDGSSNSEGSGADLLLEDP
ncbi:uncharacterized protein [Coffea arabica]|uniref:Reverse transcriptase n=1 Tax=Coffea arabica TaxID=13443 RepID=A0ABM4UG08_COFAR